METEVTSYGVSSIRDQYCGLTELSKPVGVQSHFLCVRGWLPKPLLLSGLASIPCLMSTFIVVCIDRYPQASLRQHIQILAF